ncbi:hypothetical protein ABG768_007397, partial [Culter alburnus]
VFRMLPVQVLSGYPYNIEEVEPYPCPRPWEGGRGRRSIYYPYYSIKNNVYNIFRGVGIKIATNSEVKAPVVCNEMRNEISRESVVGDGGRPTGLGFGFGGSVGNPAEKIRKFFPETWIWDLIPVG